MKILYKFLMAAVIAGGFTSCSTDIERPELQGFDNLEPKELKASSSEVFLEGKNEENEAVSFGWGDYKLSVDNPDYTVTNGSVKYYLEMSPTSDFKIIESSVVAGLTKTFTEKELNPILIRLGYEPWKELPLHVRVRYAIADNVAYQYSMPVQIQVSAYGIRFDRMNILGTDKIKVLATLYSPSENGIYTGYVAASAWMNFYMQERDNTMWGNEPNVAFKMSKNEVTFWNFWFPGQAGSYRVTANKNEEVWHVELLKTMALTSSSNAVINMNFKQSANSWSAKVTTTGAATFSAKAVTKIYNGSTGTNDDSALNGSIDFGQLVSISGAGNWIVTINMSGENPIATYAVDENPGTTYEPYLEMINQENWSEIKSRMFSSKSDGTYMGFYHAAGYENFKLATVGRETIYGSKPNSLYELDTANQSWNMFMDTDKETFNLYYVSLPENNWSYKTITSLTVAGDFNGWSASANPMVYDKVRKVWTADLDIVTAGSGLQILVNQQWDDLFKFKSAGVLGYNEGQGNIMPPGTGKYRLSINLYDMGHLTYTFTAL